MNIYQTIQKLITEGIKRQLIEKEDEIYVRNQLLSLLLLDDFHLDHVFKGERRKPKSLLENQGQFNLPDDPDLVFPSLLEKIIEYACQQGIIEDVFDVKEIFAAKIMNCLIPRPSTINDNFYKKYKESPEKATDYFYALSKNSNYIQMSRIKKNIKYKVPSEYGHLDITINLSKPEKDPKQIAKERLSSKSISYPKCVLCIENEGYAGRIGYPARSNHRMIRVQLDNEIWYLQYSPYVYYDEHCILLSEQHRNMKITRETFKRLLSFVEKFPHYFLGSNADLPIVGGSILSHDHYQGGRYEFPMAVADIELSFNVKRYPNVQCSILKWPMSVIRLQSSSKEDILELSDYILNKWKEYSDPEVGILAYTGDTPHNTITPIARIRNGQYEMDLVLRNNRTNEEHPLGIFHPHADIHHIKKENIGLIEVMGLAVLPARLKDELKEIEKYLLGKPNQIEDYHKPWAEELKQKYGSNVNGKNVEMIVKNEVGNKFLRGLLDAGVFKKDEKGRMAFQKFINELND